MSRLQGLTIILGAVLALVAAASVHAATSTYSTSITIYGAAPISAEEWAVLGEISSSNKKCVARRKVKVSFETVDGDIPVGTARASESGAWVAVAPVEDFVEADAIEATAAKLVKRKKNKRTICQPGTDVDNTP